MTTRLIPITTLFLVTALLCSEASAMYASRTGSFCSRDPIGYEGSQWNLYEYTAGRPLVAADPYGQTIVVNGIPYPTTDDNPPRRPSNPLPRADIDLPLEYFDDCGECLLSVTVKCRPIKDGLGAWFGGKHCYIEASNVSGVPVSTTSGFPEGDDVLGSFPNADIGSGGDATPFSIPTGMGACDFYRCARNAAIDIQNERHDYDRPPFTGEDGVINNSNWFVSEITNRCGGSVSFPSGATGGGNVGIYNVPPTYRDPYEDYGPGWM